MEHHAAVTGFELVVTSPIGFLTIESDGLNVTALRFGDLGQGLPTCPVLDQAAQELSEYFSRMRKTFTLPLAPCGTEFQRAVWNALQTIPYGETAAYADIAREIGKPKACRAVGNANHRNPLPIFIPCHRVIGTNGTLTGYAGGLAVKDFLLRLERV